MRGKQREVGVTNFARYHHYAYIVIGAFAIRRLSRVRNNLVSAYKRKIFPLTVMLIVNAHILGNSIWRPRDIYFQENKIMQQIAL